MKMSDTESRRLRDAETKNWPRVIGDKARMLEKAALWNSSTAPDEWEYFSFAPPEFRCKSGLMLDELFEVCHFLQCCETIGLAERASYSEDYKMVLASGGLIKLPVIPSPPMGLAILLRAKRYLESRLRGKPICNPGTSTRDFDPRIAVRTMQTFSGQVPEACMCLGRRFEVVVSQGHIKYYKCVSCKMVWFRSFGEDKSHADPRPRCGYQSRHGNGLLCLMPVAIEGSRCDKHKHTCIYGACRNAVEHFGDLCGEHK